MRQSRVPTWANTWSRAGPGTSIGEPKWGGTCFILGGVLARERVDHKRVARIDGLASLDITGLFESMAGWLSPAARPLMPKHSRARRHYDGLLDVHARAQAMGHLKSRGKAPKSHFPI